MPEGDGERLSGMKPFAGKARFREGFSHVKDGVSGPARARKVG